MTAKGKSKSTKEAKAPVGATKGQSAESPNAEADATKGAKTTSVTITKDKAAGIFKKYQAIEFKDTPDGGVVVVNKKTIPWAWTPNCRISKDSRAMYLIGQECEEFRKDYPSKDPAKIGRRGKRKQEGDKITSAEQLAGYTAKELGTLVEIAQDCLRRVGLTERKARLEAAIEVMKTLNATTMQGLEKELAQTDAALSSTTEPAKETHQAALGTNAEAMSGTAGDSEATPPSADPVASAVTEENSKGDGQVGANPEQPEGATDKSA